MNLTPKERERLTIFNAAELARRRKARGVPLNHPEAVAYVADWVCEGAREGKSVATLREQATQLLSREDVMEGVPELVDTVQVEPVFPDGTKLVTVHDPIRADAADQLDDVPRYDRLPRADAVPDGGRDPSRVDSGGRADDTADPDGGADAATEEDST